MVQAFSFSQSREQAEKEYGLESGGFLKLKEGGNKVRLLSPTVGHQSEYKGQKTFKFVCWVYDHADKKVKLFFMAPTIHRLLESLQESEEYGFTEVPMPYDITINAQNAGTKEVKYSIVPARANSPLPIDCEEQMAKKGDIVEVVQKLKEKAGEEVKPVNDDYTDGYQPEPNVGEVELKDISF